MYVRTLGKVPYLVKGKVRGYPLYCTVQRSHPPGSVLDLQGRLHPSTPPTSFASSPTPAQPPLACREYHFSYPGLTS